MSERTLPRILVVDDAGYERALMSEMLRVLGYDTVGEAANGAEAVTKYAALRPQGVLLDFVIPYKDGLQAAREIRTADPDARIIMMSALNEPALIDEAFAGGVREFLVKPFTPHDLDLALRRALAE